MAQLILQAVTDNRMRHEALQQFMLINDSVTVAMEISIYLKPTDLKHFTQKLKFKILLKLESTLTGHIDILQIRNGLIHILDFKPKARKEKPYTQLMLYALALSRLFDSAKSGFESRCKSVHISFGILILTHPNSPGMIAHIKH